MTRRLRLSRVLPPGALSSSIVLPRKQRAKFKGGATFARLRLRRLLRRPRRHGAAGESRDALVSFADVRGAGESALWAPENVERETHRSHMRTDVDRDGTNRWFAFTAQAG